MSRSPRLCVSAAPGRRPSFHLSLPAWPGTHANSSPSNIYQLSMVHLRSVEMWSICMQPEITSVMASRSAEISADVGNLSAGERFPRCTAAHLQSTASFGGRGCDSHRSEPEFSFFYISSVTEFLKRREICRCHI